MADVHEHSLSAAQLDEFHDRGFLIIKRLLPVTTVHSLRRRFADVVDQFAAHWLAHGLIDDIRDDLDLEHRWGALRAAVPATHVSSWRTALVSREVYGLWQEPHVLGAIRSIIGDEVHANGIWNGRPREPGSWDLQRVTWHQDAAYYPDWDPADGLLVTCWSPLVPVDEQSGCLQLADGSHRLDFIPFERSANGIRAVPPAVVEGIEPVSAVMAPGDVLLFQPTILHRALDNRSDYTRWSIDIRFGPATPAIVTKDGPGYLCHSATDPARVESFDVWASRYAVEGGDEAGVGSLEQRAF